ncbi:hypothetical protein BDR04DRAFT_1098968 [Suillus decipiens]|nr:hypothetical protein BDR04DRAFT_1098968 [Suillus decipiens]
MFHNLNNSTSRRRAVSYSVERHPYAYPSSSAQLCEQSISSPRSSSRHRYPSVSVVPDPIHHNPSPQSSPLDTSPSSAHGGSSRFADSQSSFTSESTSADPRRSLFNANRVPATSLHPHFATSPSPGLTGRSTSITESDLLPMHAVISKRTSQYIPSPTRRACVTPNSPAPATLETPESPVAMGIKFFLNRHKPAPPSPARHSDSGASLQFPRSHPPSELDVSAFPISPVRSLPDHTTISPSTTAVSPSLPTNSMPTPLKDKKQRNVLRRKQTTKSKEIIIQRDIEITQNFTPPSSPSPHRSVSGPSSTVLQSYDGSPLQPTKGPSDRDRTLSRKTSLSKRVSARWKKVSGEGIKPDALRDPFNARSSFQEPSSSCRLNDRGQFIDPGSAKLDKDIRSTTDPQSKSEGSKIWKLMKRISTGALRERFHGETFVPPVPAIPKELRNAHPPRSQTIDKDVQPTSRKSYSTSIPRSSIAGSGPRPSTATSSSSPNSSEIASASFFHISHSRGSSVSSYGEETLPGFPAMGDRHIMPPRELHKVFGNHAKDQGSISHSGRRSYSSGRNHSGRATPTAEGNANDQHQETSPRIQTSPITHPIHSLTSPRTPRLVEKPSTAAHTHLLPDGITSLSPPPRSVMRFSRLSESQTFPSQSTFTTPDEEPNSRTSLRAPRTLSEASTPRMRSRSSTSTSKGSSSSQLQSTVNYRELNAPRRPPLTESEKAEIWHDLLERSDQAGGTLHLDGGSKLESDNLRFSGYSELS